MWQRAGILMAVSTALIGGLKAGNSNSAPAADRQTRNATVTFRQFCTDKTTEAGADEVYIVVLGESTSGKTIAARIPSPGGHWDMNDGDQGDDNDLKGGGDSHCLHDRPLFKGKLARGETWNLAFLVMEEDGGTTGDLQKRAGQILQKSKDPYAAAGGTLLQVLTEFGVSIRDTDDWIGTFHVQLRNPTGNAVTARWRAGDRTVSSIPDPSYPKDDRRREFRMNGDGSNHVIWVSAGK